VDDLFALILRGGWAPYELRSYSTVTDIVRQMEAAKKPLAIICGLIAISAGIVKGERATCSLGIKDDLINAGAICWIAAIPTLDTERRDQGPLPKFS